MDASLHAISHAVMIRGDYYRTTFLLKLRTKACFQAEYRWYASNQHRKSDNKLDEFDEQASSRRLKREFNPRRHGVLDKLARPRVPRTITGEPNGTA